MYADKPKTDVHACSHQHDKAPRCTWKQKKDKAVFKGSTLKATSIQEVRALGRFLCPACLNIIGMAVVMQLRKALPDFTSQCSNSELGCIKHAVYLVLGQGCVDERCKHASPTC